MQQLFTALAQVEAKQPGLSGQEVQRGTRCMGECVLGDQEGAWNRCWVLDKVEDLAVVMFVDFGCSAAVPLSSLRRLDEDRFWAIKPLAHPFVLHDGVLPSRSLARQVLKGKLASGSPMESHILKFTLQAE
uniref:Tudor domain-containing protein n=1 Tax=Sphenodon punctatus TaxID=8508 RepID=A0A8D0GBF0_SPHPU